MQGKARRFKMQRFFVLFIAVCFLGVAERASAMHGYGHYGGYHGYHHGHHGYHGHHSYGGYHGYHHGHLGYGGYHGHHYAYHGHHYGMYGSSALKKTPDGGYVFVPRGNTPTFHYGHKHSMFHGSASNCGTWKR